MPMTYRSPKTGNGVGRPEISQKDLVAKRFYLGNSGLINYASELRNGNDA